MTWDGSHTNGISEVITQYCEEYGITHLRVNELAIQAGFRMRNFIYQLRARAKDGHRQAQFIAEFPAVIQPEQYPVMAEFLCRANSGLMLGNFELDYETGEVSYKTSVDVEGGELTTRMVKTQVEVNLSTMDKYAKGLIGILYQGRTPMQAIADVEGVSEATRLAAQAALN